MRDVPAHPTSTLNEDVARGVCGGCSWVAFPEAGRDLSFAIDSRCGEGCLTDFTVRSQDASASNEGYRPHTFTDQVSVSSLGGCCFALTPACAQNDQAGAGW